MPAKAPLPVGVAPLPEVILTEVGELTEGGDGVKIIVDAEKVMFMAAVGGNEIMVGVSVYKVLEAIGTVTAAPMKRKDS